MTKGDEYLSMDFAETEALYLEVKVLCEKHDLKFVYKPTLVEKKLLKRRQMKPWRVIERLKNKVSFFGVYDLQDQIKCIKAR